MPSIYNRILPLGSNSVVTVYNSVYINSDRRLPCPESFSKGPPALLYNVIVCVALSLRGYVQVLTVVTASLQ